jgi:pyruvate,water dikinase
MAVVFQEMITPYVSGIAFTSNPLNGNHNEIVSDATRGMGAAIVDGTEGVIELLLALEES